MHLGPDFRPFGHDPMLEKIFLVTRETKCWKNCFHFYFLSAACFFDIISPMSPTGFGKFVCLFSCFTSQVNSYGHCGMVSSPNHTFFLGKLEQAVYQ